MRVPENSLGIPGAGAGVRPAAPDRRLPIGEPRNMRVKHTAVEWGAQLSLATGSGPATTDFNNRGGAADSRQTEQPGGGTKEAR